MEIRLQKLGDLIASCWERAEAATARTVEEKYFDPPEEFITFLFASELRFIVREASGANAFEHAFMDDLRHQFPHLGDALKSRGGLLARVNLHSRRHEGLLSASDLGVVVTRPALYGHPGSLQIQVLRERSRGLIAQAKLNKRTKESGLKWGPLKNNQEDLLPDHLDYCALLIYQLEGAHRSKLAPFRWQLCRGFSVPDLKSWLRSGILPEELSSRDIIGALSAGTVGVDSAEIIEKIVDPRSSRFSAIEIRVFWADGDGPPERVSLVGSVKPEAQQVVKVVL